MNLQRAIEATVIRVFGAPMMVRRLLVAAGRWIWPSRHVLVTPGERGHDDTGDGPEGAGVPARLKPVPPMLFNAAAKSLPASDEENAA